MITVGIAAANVEVCRQRRPEFGQAKVMMPATTQEATVPKMVGKSSVKWKLL